MALSFLDVVGSFAQGVQERGAEVDKEIADRIKELNSKKEDSNLKSRYADEYKKFEEDKALIQSINAAGGLGTMKGLQLAGGYDSFEELQKALKIDPTLINKIKMPTIGKEPVYTPASYGLTNKTEDGKTRSTVSKMFNAAFRPEVYEKNEAFADSQVDTEETMTTYRRGKSTDMTSGQEKNLRSSLNMSRIQDKPQTLTKQIQSEDGGWQQITFTRNENGKTGPEAEKLGGKYSLYSGYSVTNSEPWQDPTQQKDGTTLDYTMMFAVDSDGNFISDDDALTRSDMKQVPVNVKAVKTGDPKDKIAIQGGMLEGYKYLQRDIVPAETATSTADMQNRDETVSWLKNDYEFRSPKWDKLITNMGYAKGTGMTDHIAETISRAMDSLQVSVADGRLVSKLDEFINSGATSLEDIAETEEQVFDPVQPNDVSSYTQEYLPTQSYYNALKDSFAYEVFINTQSQYFANKHKVPISTAVNVIEKIAKTGVTNESGDFVNFLSKFNITNPLVFDQNRKVLGPDTVSTLISQLEKYKKEIEADPRSQGQTASWSRVTDIVLNKIAEAQQ
jgi:hypothetical protein